MKRKRPIVTRKKMRARAAKKRSSRPKDRPFSRLALLILIGLAVGGGWFYYHKSVKEKAPPEEKLQNLIMENPDAEVLEMEDEGGKTNKPSNDESVPEVFRMEE